MARSKGILEAIVFGIFLSGLSGEMALEKAFLKPYNHKTAYKFIKENPEIVNQIITNLPYR
jgi:hypothetical protein